jgi:hypothetical protein
MRIGGRMAAEEGHNEFYDDLLAKVRALLACGTRSFSDLVQSLPGACPPDVVRVLGQLDDDLPAGWDANGQCASSDGIATDAWPVEHLLDFDWRFTPATGRVLLDLCQPVGGRPLAFLGSPSLMQVAADRGLLSLAMLYDANAAAVSAVRSLFPTARTVCRDLVWGQPVRAGDAAVVIADPPWYPEYSAAFLWAGSQLARIGGRVLLSLAPELTRPGIRSERQQLFAQATTYGLRLGSVEPCALSYLMPPFERNAFFAAGIPVVHHDWRRGDLAIFQVSDRTHAPRPAPPERLVEWREEAVGAVRIKCRTRPGNGFRDPTLSPLVRGDMLPSVSRRDPARADVDVWTSGNRVFRCAGPDTFLTILTALRTCADAVESVEAWLGRKLTGVEAATIRHATVQANDLVRREQQELTEHGHRGSRRGLVEAVRSNPTRGRR